MRIIITQFENSVYINFVKNLLKKRKKIGRSGKFVRQASAVGSAFLYCMREKERL